MSALKFAWRSLIRQPARALLGILGVAAVGALLFDMLLLSNGLVLSMRDLLDGAGYDIRVTASETLLDLNTDLITDAATTTEAVAALSSVESAISLRLANARVSRPGESRDWPASFQGAGGGPGRPWDVLNGRDVVATGELVLNRNLATRLDVVPGARVEVRASCLDRSDALPPKMFEVVGIAEFPFDSAGGATAGATSEAVDESCGDNVSDTANVILVASVDPSDSATAVADIASLRPDLSILTNDAAIGAMQRGNFTYFNQISSVLITVTLSFALLLITVLLTVSVNQRLAEIAALRAVGFSRRRMRADVLCESALIVGIGGLLSLPLGGIMAVWLDQILKQMPGVPVNVHFFVYQQEAFLWHGGLLLVTTIVAALYPMRIVSTLPIASTLRNEVIG